MKRTLFSVFTILSGVVGAGFLSGRELVRFFSTEGFLPLVLLCGGVFFALILKFLSLGEKYGGYSAWADTLPLLAKKAFSAVLALCCFVSLTGMFAAIGELTHPAFSFFFGVSAFFLVKKGTKGLNGVNALYLPIAFSYLFFALIRAKRFSYGGAFEWFRPLLGLSYAGMNLFLSVPVLCDLGKEKVNSFLTALFTSVLFSAILFFLLCAIRANPLSKEQSFPLLFLFEGKLIYRALSVFGCFTTLLSSYYSLSRLPRGKRANQVNAFTLAFSFALSFFGFTSIVEYAYPALGTVGLFLLLLAVSSPALFEKRDHSVHRRSHHAKKGNRRHHQIEFEHLPAVNDQVP